MRQISLFKKWVFPAALKLVKKYFLSQKDLIDSTIKKTPAQPFWMLVKHTWCSVLISAAHVARSGWLSYIYDKSLYCTSFGTSCSLFLGVHCLIIEDHTSQNYRLKFYVIEYWNNCCMLPETKRFTDFTQICPTRSKI